MKFRNYLHTSLLKTLYFNFRYLPFSQAIRLPVILFRGTVVNPAKGKVTIQGKIRHSMIKIGRCEVTGYEKHHTCLDIRGHLIFRGRANIGAGSTILVLNSAVVTIGSFFRITAGTQIMSAKEITFGDGVLISWDNLIMDSDMHPICNEQDEIINEPRPIRIGNHVWISCRNTILKGVVIPDNCVVAANSTLTRTFTETSSIIGGSAKDQRVLKSNIRWEA